MVVARRPAVAGGRRRRRRRRRRGRVALAVAVAVAVAVVAVAVGPAGGRVAAQLGDLAADRLHLLDHDVLRPHLRRQVGHAARQRHHVRFQPLEPLVHRLCPFRTKKKKRKNISRRYFSDSRNTRTVNPLPLYVLYNPKILITNINFFQLVFLQ